MDGAQDMISQGFQEAAKKNPNNIKVTVTLEAGPAQAALSEIEGFAEQAKSALSELNGMSIGSLGGSEAVSSLGQVKDAASQAETGVSNLQGKKIGDLGAGATVMALRSIQTQLNAINSIKL